MFKKEHKKMEHNLVVMHSATIEQLLSQPEAATPAHVWALIKRFVLADSGNKQLFGQAPPGDLERHIQAALEKD